MATFMETLTFDTVTCYKCGVEFGMPRSMLQKRRENGESFWCPNGHSQHFTETEVQRLERAAKRAQELLDQERRRAETLRADLSAMDRRRAAAEGQATRMKNRAAAGVCPCCNRTFRQLSQHMKQKHPEFPSKAKD